VENFIENAYLPYCKANLRPSTHVRYTFLFKMLKPHFRGHRLRDFGAVEGERLLTDFAAEKRRAQTMLKNVKGFLSGAFRYAVRTGVIRFNRCGRRCYLRTANQWKKVGAYTLKEIQSRY
jgi:hypothetical protein